MRNRTTSTVVRIINHLYAIQQQALAVSTTQRERHTSPFHLIRNRPSARQGGCRQEERSQPSQRLVGYRVTPAESSGGPSTI